MTNEFTSNKPAADELSDAQLNTISGGTVIMASEASLAAPAVASGHKLPSAPVVVGTSPTSIPKLSLI